MTLEIGDVRLAYDRLAERARNAQQVDRERQIELVNRDAVLGMLSSPDGGNLLINMLAAIARQFPCHSSIALVGPEKALALDSLLIGIRLGYEGSVVEQARLAGAAIDTA